MQEDRKLASDGDESLPLELFRRGAHHHPVTLLHGTPEQLVPHGTADQIHLHNAHMLTKKVNEKAPPQAMRTAGRAAKLVIAALQLGALAGCTTTMYLLQAAGGE